MASTTVAADDALRRIVRYSRRGAVCECWSAPIGHYRVPIYLRGKIGAVERVIEPAGVDNEEEGFGRNAGNSATIIESHLR